VSECTPPLGGAGGSDERRQRANPEGEDHGFKSRSSKQACMTPASQFRYLPALRQGLVPRCSPHPGPSQHCPPPHRTSPAGRTCSRCCKASAMSRPGMMPLGEGREGSAWIWPVSSCLCCLPNPQLAPSLPPPTFLPHLPCIPFLHPCSPNQLQPTCASQRTRS
jgi:hypothetical protein